MAQIRFVHPEETTYVRVSDMYDDSSEAGAAMRRKIPPEELHGQEVGYYFPGSDHELQLFEVRCDPDVTFNSHAHDEDEIMYVLSGEIHLGRRRYPAGSAIYIPGRTLYSFRSGPEGLRFLNFRPRKDATYITRDEMQQQRTPEQRRGEAPMSTSGTHVDQGIEYDFHNPLAGQVTMLPDPPRAKRYRTIISVDDHLVEPPDMFEGRVPRKLAERAPHIVPTPDGHGAAWLYDGVLMPNIGLAAVVGLAREWGTDPVRFEDMRPGAWQAGARVADMDLDGVYASVNFPSFLAGFGGARLQSVTEDRELALACVRAFNDWVAEEWAGAAPDRLIPVQLPWLHDPELGAEEIRRNAARGFKAVTFPEHPERSGFPSMFTRDWDPIMRACAETGTVVCIHTGSGGGLTDMGAGAPAALASLVFGSYALIPTSVWLYSMLPVRFPELKICVSEGGISWVPGLLDRLDHLLRHRENPAYYGPWYGLDISPSEVLQRNFWFCAVDDPSAWALRHRIGVDRIMLESDYPHPDSNWPNTQAVFHEQLRDVPPEESMRISWGNASELFRHSVPAAVQDDPDAF